MSDPDPRSLARSFGQLAAKVEQLLRHTHKAEEVGVGVATAAKRVTFYNAADPPDVLLTVPSAWASIPGFKFDLAIPASGKVLVTTAVTITLDQSVDPQLVQVRLLLDSDPQLLLVEHSTHGDGGRHTAHGVWEVDVNTGDRRFDLQAQSFYANGGFIQACAIHAMTL